MKLTFHAGRMRIVTLVLVVSLAIINCVSASIDVKREGYPHLEGYLFVGIVSVLLTGRASVTDSCSNP